MPSPTVSPLTRARAALRLVLAAALIAGFMPRAAASSSGPLMASLPPSEWVTAGEQREVLITLEGSSRTSQVLQVLSTLAREKAKAAFFLPASWLAERKILAMSMLSLGHRIGNRGYDDVSFTRLGRSGARASIARAERALAQLGVDPRPFLRPPGGARTRAVLEVAGAMGYRSVRWTYRPGRGSASEIARQAVARARPGSILSLDLWRPAHRAALGEIIQGVRARGLRVAGLESLRATDAVRWDRRLAAGSSGPQVRRLQERLRRLTYVPGSDGVFGEETLQAVYAFEKTQRLPRDGVVTPADMERLMSADRPAAPKRSADSFIDVDLSRQVLFEVKKDRVVQTLPISSANGEYYISDGERRKAETPTGSFKVLWKIPGWRVSDLGELWYPSYFHSGGYAIHGSPLVPTYPASHGCVRIPMSVAKSFYSRLEIGTKVFVHR